MNALKSQLLGLVLAISTGAGCLAYERLVKSTSIRSIIFLACAFYVPFAAYLAYSNWEIAVADWKTIASSSKLTWCAVIYYASWITTPIWWIVTRQQGVMTASVYEIKYIVVIAVLYTIFGDKPMTWNIVVGIGFALASIYFVSKT